MTRLLLAASAVFMVIAASAGFGFAYLVTEPPRKATPFESLLPHKPRPQMEEYQRKKEIAIEVENWGVRCVVVSWALAIVAAVLSALRSAWRKIRGRAAAVTSGPVALNRRL